MKERTKSCKLSSDLQMGAIAHMYDKIILLIKILALIIDSFFLALILSTIFFRVVAFNRHFYYPLLSFPSL